MGNARGAQPSAVGSRSFSRKSAKNALGTCGAKMASERQIRCQYMSETHTHTSPICGGKCKMFQCPKMVVRNALSAADTGCCVPMPHVNCGLRRRESAMRTPRAAAMSDIFRLAPRRTNALTSDAFAVT